MDYYVWRNTVFTLPIQDPIEVDCDRPEFTLGLDEAFDHIDRALNDDHLFSFTEEQLVLGFSLIYNNCFTDYPFCYTRFPDEDRRVNGIQNLRLLYSRFFMRYCTRPYENTRDASSNQLSMIYFCFNFWDRFVLFPTIESSHREIHAGLDVMESAMSLPNDNCIAAAMDAMACWTLACKNIGIDRPAVVIRRWHADPTTRNPYVLEFVTQLVESRL